MNTVVKKKNVCFNDLEASEMKFLANSLYTAKENTLGRGKAFEAARSEEVLQIPITVRCSYDYVRFPYADKVPYALTDNGAILLKGSGLVLDDEFLRESYRISRPYRVEFFAMRRILEEFGCKEVLGSEFVLNYVIWDESVREQLEEALKEYENDFSIQMRERNIIITFKCLSKEVAKERFCKLMQADLTETVHSSLPLFSARLLSSERNAAMRRIAML